jgi:DNA polymerase III epsilon subunit-like protein
MTDIENYSAFLHLDGNVLAAIDVETTGRRAGFHEICQIGIQILDKNLQPHTALREHYFYKNMKPKYIDRINRSSMRVNKLSVEDLEYCATQEEVADQLEAWFKRLPIPFKKRLIPLAHNWVFDRGFIEHWLGPDACNDFFHPYFRDTMLTAINQNDRCHFHGIDIPYRYVNMEYLCKVLRVENPNSHDALSDARTTAELYRRMLMLDYGEF